MNQNGQLILKTLELIEQPATTRSIISYIADTAQVSPSEVKDTVVDTLNAGVRYGFLQRSNHRYFAIPPMIPEEISSNSSENLRRDSTADCAHCRKRKRANKRRASRRRRRH